MHINVVGVSGLFREISRDVCKLVRTLMGIKKMLSFYQNTSGRIRKMKIEKSYVMNLLSVMENYFSLVLCSPMIYCLLKPFIMSFGQMTTLL